MSAPLPSSIAPHIVEVRGLRVMLDSDLAALYGVETKRFNEAVKRNVAKFPPDFMFALTEAEFTALRSQFATSNTPGRGGRRYLPRAFTEHGALMAASILNSPRAIEVSVYVVRAFVRLRELATGRSDLARRLDELERKTSKLAAAHDETRQNMEQVFAALRQLVAPPDPPKRRIGFVTDDDTPKRAVSRR